MALKIAVVTCYKDPDYIRARTLRAGLNRARGVETIIIKNSKHGLGRYGEVIKKIIKIKREDRPDAYLLTFRGYEMLPFLLAIAGKTPVIFDEFINLTEWVVDEHKKINRTSWAAKVLNNWYTRQLKKCRIILADTPAHAEYSAKRSGVPLEKYIAIPVGTDEKIFRPNSRITYMLYGQSGQPTNTKQKLQVLYEQKRQQLAAEHFQVFYYGSMLPLHGLGVVLKAAEHLKGEKHIEFLLVGGGKKIAAQIAAAKQAGANVKYKNWIPFEDLPDVIHQSSLCLAGPFGKTVQSQFVVTGKAYQFLACATPTVIGRNRASADFINKQNALVVQPGDPAELANTIRWAATHPAELQEIAKAGRQLFEQKFSTGVIAARLDSVLGKLQNDPGRG